MVADVSAAGAEAARPAFGIDIGDVDVRKLYLPDQNKQSVFERMKAERGRIAAQYRSEGERDAQALIAQADAERTRLMAQAYEEAQRIRADGEARSYPLSPAVAAAHRVGREEAMTDTMITQLRLLHDAVEWRLGAPPEDREDGFLTPLVDRIVPPLAIRDLPAVDPEDLVELAAIEAGDPPYLRRLLEGRCRAIKARAESGTPFGGQR